MKEFLEFIAKHLVDQPEAVAIEERVNENNVATLSLRVHEGEIGKIIGKKGKNAVAIRTLLSAVAAKEGRKVMLEIVE